MNTKATVALAATSILSTNPAFLRIKSEPDWSAPDGRDTLAPNRFPAAPGRVSKKGAATMQRTRRLNLLLALIMLASWLPSGGARAEAIDLTRASCTDFVAMEANDQSQIALWLAGYYAGGAQRPLLDIAKIVAAPADLLALCTKSPQLPLVGAETRAVFFPPAP